MNYLDVAHECKHRVWLWVYNEKLVCRKTNKSLEDHTGMDEAYNGMMASGRVDQKESIGSIVFTPRLPKAQVKEVVDALLDRFPGVRFLVFNDHCGEPLSDFYESL